MTLALRIPAARVRGFTLLELTVSLLAASLFLGLLSESLGGLTTANRRLVANVSEQRELATSFRVIGQLMKSATPPHPLLPSSQFVGSPEEAVFLANPSEGLPGGGTWRIRFYREIEASGNTALLTDATAITADGQNTLGGFKRHRLFAHLQSVAFRYYERTEDGLLEFDRWSDPEKLPSLIRLVITPSGGGQPIAISAAPRRNASSHCRFDSIGLTCR